MSLYEHIPNNVDLSNDKRLLRALEHLGSPTTCMGGDMGPEGFQADDVVPAHGCFQWEAGGLGAFRLPSRCRTNRWGIFLAASGA